MIGVTGLKSNTVSLIDPSFHHRNAIKVGRQPMDMASAATNCSSPARRQVGELAEPILA
jgi:hypothetical protein